MAIPFSDNFNINVGAPIDAKYLTTGNTTYASTSAVISAIERAQRYIGLTVNVNNVEYWFSGGTANGNLVLKTVAGGGGGTGTITGATNGLHVQGKNIALGGSLTGDTVIGDALYEYHLKYGNNYALNYTNRSLVDKEYVDSIMFGTQYHIPIFTLAGNQIMDSTLIFTNNTLYNPDDLTIHVEDTKSMYLVATNGAENNITLGKYSISSAVTNTNICVAGQAVNIDLTLASKGTGCIFLNSSSIYFASNGSDGMHYEPISKTLRLPINGHIRGYSGIGDATPICVIGGCGASAIGFCGYGGDVNICGGNAGDGVGGNACKGGDIILKAGAAVSGGIEGKIKLCNLPLQSIETAVVYVDTSGNLSCGIAAGGAGLYNSDSPVTCEVGGIAVNYVLTGKSLVCILKDMLVPEKFGLLSNPSNTSPITSNVYEIGKIISPLNITASFDRGSINPAYWTNGTYSIAPTFRSGTANKHNFTGIGTAGSYVTTSSSHTCVIANHTVTANTTTWGVSTTYNGGPQPRGSKNTTFNSAWGSGTTTPINYTIRGILPYYWGYSTSAGAIIPSYITNPATGTKVVLDVTSDTYFTFNASGSQYVWFAFPNCAAIKHNWFQTGINYGTIGINYINNPVTVTLNSFESCWSGEPYKLYVSMYASETDPATQFRIF